MEPKPISHLMRDALRAPRTAGIFVIALIYTGSIVLDQIASSYPPVPNDACATMAAAQRLGGISLVLILVGGFVSFIGLAAARGRRWWYLVLLVVVPILILIVVKSVLWPGANCRPFD